MMNNPSKNDYISFKELWDARNRILSRCSMTKLKLVEIIKEYQHLNIDDLSLKFTYETIKQSYTDFCPLYLKGSTCHNMPYYQLNCYGCLCPQYKLEFSFDDTQNLYRLGICLINSKYGFYKLTQTKSESPKNILVLNCLDCKVPHYSTFIKKYIKKEQEKLKKEI